MKKDLMNILCCPTCKGDLEIIVEKEENEEIIEGKFNCKKCKVTYVMDSEQEFKQDGHSCTKTCMR